MVVIFYAIYRQNMQHYDLGKKRVEKAKNYAIL